jgi:hypothetical protein
MRINVKVKRAAAAILLSLLMASVLEIVGLLVGSFLWSRYGPPANDPDQVGALFCGVIVGTVMAIGGVVAILWRFWPRNSLGPSRTRASYR